jgi:hypothetical protein
MALLSWSHSLMTMTLPSFLVIFSKPSLPVTTL